MNQFVSLITQDRRLAILRFLNEDKGFSLNTSVLQDALCAIGHSVSRDEVHTVVAWLSEQGLANIEQIGAVTVVKLTGRGVDVATGAAVQPGVKRPRPR